MRPRLGGKILVAVVTTVLMLLALGYGIGCKENEDLYRGIRGVTLALLALTSATCYRYFED